MLLLPVQDDLAAIASRFPDHGRAEKNPHQGGLSGSVFAHQSDDLTLPDGQVDVCQYVVRKKIFFDIPQFKKRSIFVIHALLSKEGEEQRLLPCVDIEVISLFPIR